MAFDRRKSCVPTPKLIILLSLNAHYRQIYPVGKVVAMKVHADKIQEDKRQSFTKGVHQKQTGEASTSPFADNRPEATAQRKLREIANSSQRVKQLRAFRVFANHGPQAEQAAQLQAIANQPSPYQPRFSIQRKAKGVVQAVWAFVDAETGERLNLRANADGTYTHSATGRRFNLVSAGPPLIVTAITGNPNRRGRPLDWQADDAEVERVEHPTRRVRTEESSNQNAVEGGEEQVSHTLTDEEMTRIGEAGTHRFTPSGNRRALYGDNSDDFLGRACWNWALSGGCGDPINPAPLFDMLGDESHAPGGALFDRSFENAWQRYLPRPVDGHSDAQQDRTRLQQEGYERHQEQIRGLWDRRRSLSAPRGRARGNATSSVGETTEQITNDAVRLAMQMNNLQPADPGESTPFAIAMARHPDRGVNWSHWGLEVNGHSFETIPDWGLWHQQEGFEYWADQTESIEDSQVTRVPLRNLTPGHVTGIRGLLNVMGGGRGSQRPGRGVRRPGRGARRPGRGARRPGSSSGRGTGGRGTQTSVSGGGEGQVALVPVAPGNNLDAGGMVLHYHGILDWANAQGTYSPEFHWVRDHPAAAVALLQQGGMTAGSAQIFTQQFAAAVQHFGQQAAEHVRAEIQEQINGTLGVQEQLFAIIRYLRREEGEAQQPGGSESI
jgi:hypothetical protein